MVFSPSSRKVDASKLNDEPVYASRGEDVPLDSMGTDTYS